MRGKAKENIPTSRPIEGAKNKDETIEKDETHKKDENQPPESAVDKPKTDKEETKHKGEKKDEGREAVIEFRNVTKTYPGDVKAVEGVSFSILSGEFISLVGPSGAGKSTLVKFLTGEEAPTGGAVLVGAMYWLIYLKDRE